MNCVNMKQFIYITGGKLRKIWYRSHIKMGDCNRNAISM